MQSYSIITVYLRVYGEESDFEQEATMTDELPGGFVPRSLRRQHERIVVHAKNAILNAREGVTHNVRLIIKDGIIDHVQTGVSADHEGRKDGEKHYCFTEGYLIPGLIDAHVHLGMPGYRDVGDETVGGKFEPALIATQNLNLALRSGLTSVRDCGMPAGLGSPVARLLRDGWIDGPRVIHSGPGLTGGISDSRFEVCSVRDAAVAVRNLVREDVDFIKAYASGGGRVNYQRDMGRVDKGPKTWQSHLTTELLSAIVEEAHAYGLMVTAHATDPLTVSRCVEAGLDGIEHAELLTGETSYNLDEELIDRIADAQIFICPTLTASWRLFKSFEAREDQLSHFECERLAYLRNLSEQSLRGFEMMVSRGVRIAAGSDAGTMLNPLDDFASELELMGLNGMTNSQVLDSATRVAADALALGRQTGRLMSGFLADMTVLKGNPLEDLTAYERVDGVFVHGRRML